MNIFDEMETYLIHEMDITNTLENAADAFITPKEVLLRQSFLVGAYGL